MRRKAGAALRSPRSALLVAAAMARVLLLLALLAVGAVAPKADTWQEYVKISVKQANPKQQGSKSHARYERYKAATTVGEYLRLGGYART